jgi:threonine dehydratase
MATEAFRVAAPTLEQVVAARENIRGIALRTPLVQLPARPGEREVWLKLETLQPIGSFKIRGGANALALAPKAALANGVWTASAGNMAQAVGWCARLRGIPCTVVVPDHAPRAKRDAIERLGGRVIAVPFERWWKVFEERRFEGMEGHFVHPVSDTAVIAGNGTIGLEILEDLPTVAAVLVPFGGGGLSCGIAAALQAAAVVCPRSPVKWTRPRHSWRRSWLARRRRSSIARASWTASAAVRCWRTCGRWPQHCSRARAWCRWRRSPRR